MDQHSQQPISARSAEEAVCSARRALAESGATPARCEVIAALAEPLNDGWTCLQDLQSTQDGAVSLSFLLCGPGGVIVVETASSIASESRDAAAAGACWLAAVLPPSMRATVFSVVVVPGGGRASLPPSVDGVVQLDEIAAWVQAKPTLLDSGQVLEVIEQLRVVSPTTAPTLLTTRDMLPVSDGLPESQIPRQRLADDPPATRPRVWRRAGSRGAPHRPSAGRSDEVRAAMRAHPSNQFGTAHSQASARVGMSDMIRVAMVCTFVLIALWFWGVVSDVADGTDNDPLGPRTAVVVSSSKGAGTTSSVATPGLHPPQDDGANAGVKSATTWTGTD